MEIKTLNINSKYHSDTSIIFGNCVLNTILRMFYSSLVYKESNTRFFNFAAQFASVVIYFIIASVVDDRVQTLNKYKSFWEIGFIVWSQNS